MDCTRLPLLACEYHFIQLHEIKLGTVRRRADDRTGTAALDMISKISLDREETHLVPLVRLSLLSKGST